MCAITTRWIHDLIDAQKAIRGAASRAWGCRCQGITCRWTPSCCRRPFRRHSSGSRSRAACLAAVQVKFLAPQEVVAAQNQGAPVIDIRPRGEWEAGHVPGSVNVEYLRLISGEGLFCRRSQ